MVVPLFGGCCGADACALGLIEEVDDGFLGVFDVGPVLAGELGLEMNHWAERGAVLEFGGVPGVPVGDGVYGAFEVYFVHHLGTVFGVGPVPEETALFDDHVGGLG